MTDNLMYLKQKEGRQRGTWNGKKTDTDFYKKIVRESNYNTSLTLRSISLIMLSLQVDAYEAKNQELMAENTNLRALLRSMQVSSKLHT